jgi:hypothetical protein
MPTNRRRIDRGKGGAITPEVIASWPAADHHALHSALGLKVWQDSPLPPELHGVDEDSPADNEWYRQSLRLQRKLMKLCGFPSDCRHVYEKDLKDAESWRDYCIELIRNPEYGGIGTGCDPISRRHKLEEAEEKVAYYKQLLAEP